MGSDVSIPAIIEHTVPRDGGTIYIRAFAGSDPALASLHGSPDNSHIDDDLIPHPTAAARRVIAIDFLGFALHRQFPASPQQLAWPLNFQRDRMQAGADHDRGR